MGVGGGWWGVESAVGEMCGVVCEGVRVWRGCSNTARNEWREERGKKGKEEKKGRGEQLGKKEVKKVDS